MLRLFLSVDMAGSTEFKSRLTAQGAQGWLDIFQAFFTRFPLMVAGQLGFEFLDDDATPSIEVWKVMGDEVVFVTSPASAEELTSVLLALVRTLALYEERHFANLPLRLKGTAWLADFDGQNIEIEIPELSSSARGAHLDFIGPDIDLGFRISKYAPPGALVVSTDVLEAILAAGNRDRADLHLLGAESLKGVMHGRPYPIVWMLGAGDRFAFTPEDQERDPRMAAAAAGTPASFDDLRGAVAEMRRDVARLQGYERPPVRLAR